jgi:peroxiredoxin family protein
VSSEPLGILLISGTHERAHYAFILAAGAAALGRRVVLFATNEGCRALCVDWSGLHGSGRDAGVRARGVAGIGELRDSAVELGVQLMACEAGMRLDAIEPEQLMPGVQVVGVASFLEACAGGQMLSL